MTKEGGRNVVFFSGGIDSTLVAVDLLRERKPVTLVNFDNSWIGGASQQNQEKLRMKGIIKRMKSEFGEGWIKENKYTWDGDLFANGLQKNGWVSLFPLALASNDNAYFGIIRYSDFWHFRDKWEKAFNAVLDAHEKTGVKLKYPLEWCKKNDIKKRLKRIGYLDLALHSGDSLNSEKIT